MKIMNSTQVHLYLLYVSFCRCCHKVQDIQNELSVGAELAKWIECPLNHWVPGSEVLGSIPGPGNRNLHDQGL